MSQNIRLFPTYSQKENQTTNHCLLILKMMYEESPKFLSEVLSVLLGENFSGAVGVKFIQQQKEGGKIIPDGQIMQEPFSIWIETKLGSDFTKKQLVKYLENLKEAENRKEKLGEKILIALGNFEGDPDRHDVIEQVQPIAKEYEITFTAVSFEQFFEAIQSLPYLPKNLVDAISDLGEYFDENNLLPSWKYRLDVVNCRMSFDTVLAHKIYTCPAQGGTYRHRRSLYFGAYRNKCVEQIAQIQAVVDLESKNESKLLWKNCNQSDEDLKKTALERYIKSKDSFYPVRVFVLGDLFPTNFMKVSPGGMQGSKQYFDLSKLKITDAQDLANQLQGKTWENYV